MIRDQQDQIIKYECDLKSYESAYGVLSLEHEKTFAQVQINRIEELQTKCAFYERTEAALSGEIESIGQAWANLDEIANRKILDAIDKQEHVTRLTTEVYDYFLI